MRFACIGVGNIGRSWAVTFARAGYPVRLWDSDRESLSRAQPLIHKALRDIAAVDTALDADKAFKRVQICKTMERAVHDADYVQESTAERVAVKRQVFNMLSRCTPEQCILASSTSAIPGSDFLQRVNVPGRCLIAHPVNPPHIIPLVELCAAPGTDSDVLQRVKSIMEQLGQAPIVVNSEITGFVVNRLQWALLGEAMHLVAEGYCGVDDIDRVLTKGLALRWALMGPFEVGHLNATEGLRGYFATLQQAITRVQNSLQTDYAPNEKLISQAHNTLSERVPVSAIADYQRLRDQRLLKLRRYLDDTDALTDTLDS